MSWKSGTDGAGTFRLSGLKRDFDKLALMIRNVEYMKLDSFYGPAVTDILVVTVSVEFGKTRKSIVDLGKSFQPKDEKEAPEMLKRIEKTLLDMCISLKWEKVDTKPNFPRFMPTTDNKG